MSAFRSDLAAAPALLAGLLLLGGCYEQGQYVYGTDLASLAFVRVSDQMGIWPDTSVLDVDVNPWALGPPVGDEKWDVEAAGYPIASFYSWASLLTVEPTGEAQYYAASNLHTMYTRELVASSDVFALRGMTIGAYTSVLTNFPDAVSFLADGQTSFRLAPLAYYGILDMGGTPPPGWMEVTRPDGGTEVVFLP